MIVLFFVNQEQMPGHDNDIVAINLETDILPILRSICYKLPICL